MPEEYPSVIGLDVEGSSHRMVPGLLYEFGDQDAKYLRSPCLWYGDGGGIFEGFPESIEKKPRWRITPVSFSYSE